MVFAVSVAQGAFAGHVLRSEKTPNKKVLTLLGIGVACLMAGWIWSLSFPIVKHLWTSSMVLWSGGWCYLLLGLFYWVIDVKCYRKWAFPLVVIGVNAITVYTVTRLYDFGDISDIFLEHLAPRLGAFGSFLSEFGALLVPWLILLYMYRKKTFIRV
jgi:predicted acyltransferase